MIGLPVAEDALPPASIPLKTAIQAHLIKHLPPDSSPEQIQAAIAREVAARVAAERHLLTASHERLLARAIRDEMLGLGPLEPLLADPTVSEIMVNGPHEIWIERSGRLVRTDIRFEDDEHLLRIIHRIVGRVGRRAETEVRLAPTESLALGGLLSNEDAHNVAKLPLIGDIPILGELFKSHQFLNGDTELMIIVTPTLVQASRREPEAWRHHTDELRQLQPKADQTGTASDTPAVSAPAGVVQP